MSFFLATVVLAVSSSSLSFELYRQHEQQFPPIPVKSSPKAGAIVLLGVMFRFRFVRDLKVSYTTIEHCTLSDFTRQARQG